MNTKGRGRLEVIEMRIASSAGTNSSSLMPSSSSSSASTSTSISSVPYNPYMPSDGQKGDENDIEKDRKSNKEKDLSNKNDIAIGMVVKDKRKKKKEKREKAIGENTVRNKNGSGGKSDDDTEYSLNTIFRGTFKFYINFHYFIIFCINCRRYCKEIHFLRIDFVISICTYLNVFNPLYINENLICDIN